MVQIIAFANQKGGVGKTTTAINLAASLAAIKKRVLLVDLDSQCNASTGLGFVRASHPQSVYGVLAGQSRAVDNILTTAVPGLHLMPSSPVLAGAENYLMDNDGGAYLLRNALMPIYEHYDYILLDCPPALGALTLNALTVATNVIIPLQCEFFALQGVSDLMANIRGIREKWNPELEILGILLTMYDRRYGQTHQAEKDVRDTFGDLVFKTVIPRNVRVSEAPSHGIPALLYDFKSPGAQAYLRVATEVVERLEQGE